MNVYIHRYENLNVYSTARKVLESLAGEWEVYNAEGNIEIDNNTIPKLITKLNKEWFLPLESGGEHSEIVKEEVQ